MLAYIKKIMNRTLTENGAVSYETTGSECLDLFATVGALRRESDEEIVTRFVRAYAEDPDAAMKLLFFARDIRGGLGERRVFRVIMRYLAMNEPSSVLRNLGFVAEYGRWDDLTALLGTPCEGEMLRVIREQFQKDMTALETGGEVSLLGKWLPSVNASNGQTVRNAKRIAKSLALSEESYRKALTALRKRIRIIENSLRERDYSFDYEKQPSKALFRYRKAFMRNDKARYTAFLGAANDGRARLHAENVAPYELVAPYLKCDWGRRARLGSFLSDMTPEEKAALNATWAALPDYGNDENALPVIDTSGSMYIGEPLPAAVALSLGLYAAEHSRGAFANHFIAFSAKPRLIGLKGETFVDRLRYAASFSEVANTDIEAVFDLILKAATEHRVKQKELPAKLIVISDMEFDCCVKNAKISNFEAAKAAYERHGYRLPQIVFWNVASRNRQQPVTKDERGVVLVSGVTPKLFEMIAGGQVSPYRFMMEILGSERYAKISA